MERIDAIWKRASIRKFKPDPVSPEMIELMLDAATRAPTGGNVQPWEFMLIDSPDMRKQIVAETYAGYYSGPGNPQLWILEAPVLFVVLCNFKRTLARYGDDAYKWAPLDAAAAMQNIILSATELGLGSCWIGGFREERVRELLALPRLVRPIGLLPVGWPDEEKPRKPRLPLNRLVHKDRYGTPYYREG